MYIYITYILLTFIDVISSTLDNNNYSQLVMVYICTAFDMNYHHILLFPLHLRAIICISWFSSYLFECSRSVNI